MSDSTAARIRIAGDASLALQRTRDGQKPQWLLIKRRDEHARPGSDVVAERPESVESGLTLAAVAGSEGD